MTTRQFALVLGLGFVVAGIAGFFPTPADPPEGLTQTHGFGKMEDASFKTGRSSRTVGTLSSSVFSL